MTRDEVQRLLQLAAIADGQPASRYGSHSLRIGGATAIYMTSQDLEHVKRYGRWASSVWESHGRQKDLAKGMARANGQLLPPRQLRAQEAEKVGAEDEEKNGQFHRDMGGGYLKQGGPSYRIEGPESDTMRVVDVLDYKDGQSKVGPGPITAICRHLGEIAEKYYTKLQQYKQQHVYVISPEIMGKEGHETIAWTHFATKKCLRLVPS